MTMIELVARAIGCQMDHCWDRDTDRCSVCLDTARAAIAAMKLPEDAWSWPHLSAVMVDDFNWVIDKALKGD